MNITQTERQVLSLLPATTDDLVTQLSVSPSTVRTHLSNLREKGWEFGIDESGRRTILQEPNRVYEEYDAGSHTQSKSVVTKTAKRRYKSLWNELAHLTERYPEPVRADGGLKYTKDNVDLILHRTDVHVGSLDVSVTADIEAHMAARTIEAGEEYARNGTSVDTVHVAYGGDMVDGQGIYPGQGFETRFAVDEQVQIATEILFEQVTTLADAFPTVQVIVQPGNHGEIRTADKVATANFDNLVYGFLDILLRTSGYDNVEFVSAENQYYTNFAFRNGLWKGQLRHGHDRGCLKHIQTKAGMDFWSHAHRQHRFHLGLRGHYHQTKVEYMEGGPVDIPIIMTGSPVPPGNYEDGIGVGGNPDLTLLTASDTQPVSRIDFVKIN